MADMYLDIGVDVEASVAEFRQGINQLVEKINADPPKIKVSLVTTDTKAATQELQNQLNSVSKAAQKIDISSLDASSMQQYSEAAKTLNARLLTMEKRLNQVGTASKSFDNASSSLSSMQQNVSSVSAALKDINARNSVITDSYKSLYRAMGGTTATGDEAAQLEVVQKKYTEMMEAVENLKQLKATASQEDIDNIYTMQTGLESLINTTREQSVAASENERTIENMAKVSESYNTAIQRGEAALRNYTAAEYSNNAASVKSYDDIKKATEAYRELYQLWKDDGISNQQMAEETKKYSQTVQHNTTVIKSNGDAHKSLSGIFKNVITTLGSLVTTQRVVSQVIQTIRKMVNASIELNDAMTQLKIVTDETDSAYESFSESIAKSANSVGTAVTDLVESTTTYSRLGYSLDESETLATYTAMLQNVGDIDTSDAQDAITSMIKAFDISADDMQTILDKLVVVGNNYPISVEDIAAGMTNASSTLAAAGNSIEETIALLTAANTTVNLCRAA